MENILSLLEGMKKISDREWAGPCPMCGGTDRFVVWLGEGRGRAGRYMCRGCDTTGDALDLAMRLQRWDFRRAADFFGVETKDRDRRRRDSSSAGPAAAEIPEIVDLPPEGPSETWRLRAEQVLDAATENIRHRDSLAFLDGRRLTLETARRFGIGWTPEDRWEDPALWDLPPTLSDRTGRPRQVWIPAGAVWPLRDVGGNIVGVKIRRSAYRPEDEMPKHIAIRGSRRPPQVIGEVATLPTVIVESELDGFLVAQECSDIASCVALAGVGGKPKLSEPLVAGLSMSPKILVALDADAPGAAASRWWLRHFKRTAVRWPSAIGKDVGEMVQGGIDVRDWIRAGLRGRTA